MTRLMTALVLVALSASATFGQTKCPAPSHGSHGGCHPGHPHVVHPRVHPYGYAVPVAVDSSWRSPAAVIEAQAQWNLLTSQAMINVEEAKRLALENHVTKAATFFQARQVNQEALNRERQGRPTQTPTTQ